MTTLSRTLDAVEVGHPLSFRNMTVFPLLRPAGDGAVDYVSLSEALRQRTVSIQETSDSGTVPFVRLENSGEAPVLLVDGEELVGAKQNRILNLTILAPAATGIDIPVTCVEAGRWARRTRSFGDSEHMAYRNLRAQKMGDVSGNMMISESRAGNQSASWDELAQKSVRMGTRSPTGAMSDIYESYHDTLQSYKRTFRAAPGQVGAVFDIRGRIAGMEYFESPDIFRRLFPKLVGSYALDAIETGDRARPVPDRKHGIAFVDAVRKVPSGRIEKFKAIGLGRDIRFSNDAVIGSALRRNRKLVHLSVFPADSHKGERRRTVHRQHTGSGNTA